MVLEARNVRGTRDFFGYDYKLLKFIQDLAYKISLFYSFIPIDIPIIQFSDIFKRSLDPTSDIISKEIYEFTDKSNERIALRPEFTAPVARAFVQNLQHKPLPLKLFSVGPLFRYERPQKGRLRQFNQFNFEIIGAKSYHYDIELIQLALEILTKLNLNTSFELEINSLGDEESKTNYRIALIKYLSEYKKNLSEDSKRRLETNALRIFDSKDKCDQEILNNAPRIYEYYNKESKIFFDSLKSKLEDLGIHYKINYKLVRGLDYYSHSVFEFKTEEEKSQNTIIGGGRYDNLINIMGGNPTSCVGFAGGIERLMDISDIKLETYITIAVIPIGKNAEEKACKIVRSLREHHFCVEYIYDSTLNKRIHRSSEKDFAVIFGDDELKLHVVKIKDMKTGNETIVNMKDIVYYLDSQKN